MLIQENFARNTKKINILFFIDYLHGFGGTERFLFNLVTRLNRDLFNCLVCPFSFDQDALKIFRDAGIHVEPTPLPRIYGLSAFKQASKIRGLICKYNIDIVQTFNIDSDIYGTIIAKFSGVPVIISSRRDLGTYRKKRHLMLSKITHKYVSHFLAVCDAVAKNLSETESIRQDKITTVYNGIDLADSIQIKQEQVAKLAKYFRIDSTTFVIGNVSHFRPEKGYDIFFEAIRKIKPLIPKLRVLAVGGGGSLLNKFRETIREEGSEDFVFLTGYAANVFDYVSLMDVCCLTPVSNEGFSNALLEQMAMAKAVIATDMGGNKEAIIHNESGFIIPPNDVNALTEAIMKLYKSKKLRTSLGANAKKRVETEFGMDKMVRKMEQFYHEIYQKNTNGCFKLKSGAISSN